jgi:multidrug efflux system membrane fusion protein
MRLFPILTAIAVVSVLYLLVFERDRLLSFAGREPAEATSMASDSDDVAADTAPLRTDAVSVVAIQSEARVIDSAVIVRGRTEAARQVDVRSETSGLVISEPLRKGTRVEAGELLCRLDVGTRDAALAEAESRMAEARARQTDAEVNLRAASRLSEGGFASETRLTAAQAASESARAGVLSAEAAIASAKKEIERLEIRAPFAGLLETDTSELGSLLQPGGVCATVIQLDRIKLVGFVPEVDVDSIQVGAQAGAKLATGREVLGKVTFLSRSADSTTRTFRVEVQVDNADLSIRDGQTAEIFISSDGALAHLIPQSALTLNDEGRMGVRVVENAQASFQSVSIVRDVREGIWVTGLEEAVKVIVVGQEYVTDGVPVDVTMREPPQ